MYVYKQINHALFIQHCMTSLLPAHSLFLFDHLHLPPVHQRMQTIFCFVFFIFNSTACSSSAADSVEVQAELSYHVSCPRWTSSVSPSVCVCVCVSSRIMVMTSLSVSAKLLLIPSCLSRAPSVLLDAVSSVFLPAVRQVDVAGVLQLSHITIDTASSVLLTLSVGLAVDYSAHVGHTFMTFSGPKNGQ